MKRQPPHPLFSHRASCALVSSPWRTVAPLLIVATLIASACSTPTTGRELGPDISPPAFEQAEGNTAPAPQQNVPLAEAGDGGFEILSPSFTPGGELSEAFTSAGFGLWPAFDFVNVPDGTVELVLVATDADNSNFVHWVVSSIPPDSPGFEEGALPDGVIEHLNGAGLYGWFAPSKALGAVHRYQFQLYALDEPLGLGADHDLPAVLDTLDRQNLSRSSIMAILIG